MQAQAEAFGVEHTALGRRRGRAAGAGCRGRRRAERHHRLGGPRADARRPGDGRTLALANKESLIVGGELVTAIAAPGQIVPVDSEHSAIAQALRSGSDAEVRRLVLTASGGPFRGRSRAELDGVTPAEALAHPTWDMGRVVTTNSATLVNKGLEVIEAHLLFGIGYDDIDVVVHPQSIVHSMVEFIDGSTIAQASPPDMRLPISLGLDWPNRVGGVGRPLDWTTATSWTFEPLDDAAFPAVRLAKRVGRAGGTYPAVFNAANEQAVDAFHEGRLSFPGIVELIERVVESHEPPRTRRRGRLTRESLRRAPRRGRGMPPTARSPRPGDAACARAASAGRGSVGYGTGQCGSGTGQPASRRARRASSRAE